MLALVSLSTRSSARSGVPTSSEKHDAGAPLVEAPVLLQAAEAEYPAAALPSRSEAVVMLTLTIDKAGTVTDVSVAQSGGVVFDEAAREAAFRLRFAAARRGETAVAARISYVYRFAPPAPEVVADASAGDEVKAGKEANVTAEPDRSPNGDTTPRTSDFGSTREQPPALGVEVRGLSQVEQLRQSAEAVQVVETERARQRSADLGEVLARSEGVGVRRSGGLGSSTRFSLQGLSDEQVRFFLDGVPLEFAGYPFGIANVPVNALARVEIFRGVVPIRFGADALGGAVNLVSPEPARGNGAAVSYQVGSFGTYRLSLGSRLAHARSGFVMRAGGFIDRAKNDYPVDVEVPDASGWLFPARVRRFHDGYRASGGNLELGFEGRPWAKRLLLRAFVTDYEKELQHNIVMTVPYGAVSYGETSGGATLRYETRLAQGVSLDSLVGYSHTRSTFLDVSDCVYDWFGHCINRRPLPGEIDSRGYDRVFWTNSALVRVNLRWLLAQDQALRVSVAPTYVTRTGDERKQRDPEARDPLTAERKLFTLVSGLEYELDHFDDRLENIAFVKHYLQEARSEEPLPGNIFRRRDRSSHRFGVGDAVRYRLLDWLYAKGSYELATRSPRTDEVFGDAALILANLELQPERSHNLNVGARLDRTSSASGDYRAELNLFLRHAEQLIVLVGNDRYLRYENVFGARSMGVEASAGWTEPTGYVALDANVTYLDFRNTSSAGTFGAFVGDRIPNRPYLFANGNLELRLPEVGGPRDQLLLIWTTRYVHSFFRGWESVGLVEFKQVVPSQLLHSLALTYLVRRKLNISSTLEVQNLTDQRSFDFFGVQRPGRAYYFKGTLEF